MRDPQDGPTDEEERQMDLEAWEEKYGELGALIEFAYYHAKPAKDDRELFLGMARIIATGMASAELKDQWTDAVAVYAPPPRLPPLPPNDDDIPF